MTRRSPGIARVLWIDDDAGMQKWALAWLTGYGLSLELRLSGATGLASVGAGLWDLIVLNRDLPDLSGEEIVQAIRGAGVLTPILLCVKMEQASMSRRP